MQVASNNALSSKRRQTPIRVEEVRTSELEEFFLLREMAHRINNELTSTIGIISCDADRSNNCDVKVALAKVIEHLYDHARVYHALQMPTANRRVDAALYLRELCQSISRAKLRHAGVELVLVEHPLQLSATQCWRLGLIVAELITNASRHAFAYAGGTIRVELKKRGASVECRVADDGSGQENIRPGQGLGIIQQLARGLNGSINHRFGSKGTVAIVSFPIEEIIQDVERLRAGTTNEFGSVARSK
jgi:two-component sensor histidine kinase